MQLDACMMDDSVKDFELKAFFSLPMQVGGSILVRTAIRNLRHGVTVYLSIIKRKQLLGRINYCGNWGIIVVQCRGCERQAACSLLDIGSSSWLLRTTSNNTNNNILRNNNNIGSSSTLQHVVVSVQCMQRVGATNHTATCPLLAFSANFLRQPKPIPCVALV